jgi:hypothetical protein
MASVICIFFPPFYQLALRTPGISPLWARFLKHILHIPKRRKKPRGLPQIPHRVYPRVLNFGTRFCFATSEAFAMYKTSPFIKILRLAAFSGKRRTE